MRDGEVQRPGFLWRGILILLPLGLLAAAGLYSLRQDRALADVEARERARQYADSLVLNLSNRLATLAPDPALSSIEIGPHHELVAIGGSTNRAHLPWPPTPASSSAAQALFDQALLESNPVTRDHEFAEVETNRAARSEAGLPLWLMAEYQRVKLHPSPTAADALSSDAINFPSFVTPEILRAAQGLGANKDWTEEWRRDQRGREFYQAAIPALRQSGPAFWFGPGDQWFVVVRGAQLIPLLRADVMNAQRAALAIGRPPYVGGAIILGNAGSFQTDGLVELARARAGPVRARVDLANPAVLYGRQRRRTMWFAAVILLSAAAAGLGLAGAWRGYEEQRRLSEMKSNFVSSVSHELRAPIASMRLLAEGLERGRVADAVKQKEYYQLLSQEARRLSTLIENILDYSRIEQGRKKYEMEPANLAALARQTVAVMAPAATERKVRLTLSLPGAADPESAGPRGPDREPCLNCDGLAIQQALINLIDNAVKHSPPGCGVTVGLEEGADACVLWVEDQGPGIPPGEQAKIFERFYRRGTELRRETQGIGVGLTIVKHIVEAHGGRVVVRSEVGQGSRFTLELPK